MSSWFEHKDCGGDVMLDCTDAIQLVASFGVSNSGLRMGLSTLIQKKPTALSSKFVCKKCSKSLELEDIGIICFGCAERFPVAEMFIPNKGGGMYCKSCLDEHFETVGGKPAQKIFEQYKTE